jgi:hypothetical protein
LCFYATVSTRLFAALSEIITIPLSENDFLISSHLSDNINEKVIYLLKLGLGAREIVSVTNNSPDFPQIYQLTVISFFNDVLTFQITYTSSSQEIDVKRRIIQLSGDWEKVGLQLDENIADLNKDGNVDQLDLLLFIQEWNK